MEPGLHCDDSGVVSIVSATGPLVTWQQPTFGQWRAVNAKVQQYAQHLEKVNKAARTVLDDSASKKDRDAAQKVLDTEGGDTVDVVAPLLRFMVETVPHEGPGLPDDTDEWPAWLALSPTTPIEVFNYWRKRPKPSGSTTPAT